MPFSGYPTGGSVLGATPKNTRWVWAPSKNAYHDGLSGFKNAPEGGVALPLIPVKVTTLQGGTGSTPESNNMFRRQIEQEQAGCHG